MSGMFLTDGRWSNEPAGYTFQADNYCPSCLIEVLIGAGIASPGARDMVSIEALEQIAAANCIDFDDEYSYDSDDFPKVITNGAGAGEHCGRCSAELPV